MGIATDFVVKNTMLDAVGANRGMPATYNTAVPPSLINGSVVLINAATRGIFKFESDLARTEFKKGGGIVVNSVQPADALKELCKDTCEQQSDCVRTSYCKASSHPEITYGHCVACLKNCFNHGSCDKNGVCQCDSGYKGAACDKIDDAERATLNTGELIGICIGLACAWVLLIAPIAKVLVSINTNDAWDLFFEVLAESFLDAMEMSAAVLIFSSLTSDSDSIQWAQVVLICFALINIVGLDVYSLYIVCRENPDLRSLISFRNCHSIFTIMLVLPISGLEVKLYLDSLNVTDLICVIVLSIDVGYRLKSALQHVQTTFFTTSSASEQTQPAPTKDEKFVDTKDHMFTSQGPAAPTVQTGVPNEFSGCCSARQ